MRKLKTALPSLKAKMPRMLKSHVVYQIKYPGCQSSYVGQATRHLSTRIREHSRNSSNVGKKLSQCGVALTEDNRQQQQLQQTFDLRGPSHIKREAKNQHKGRIQITRTYLEGLTNIFKTNISDHKTNCTRIWSSQ